MAAQGTVKKAERRVRVQTPATVRTIPISEFNRLFGDSMTDEEQRALDSGDRVSFEHRGNVCTVEAA